MVTIKRAAELTGVSEYTLRAWERRYGLLGPARASSGYRQYGPDDLRLIHAMKSLVDDGWTPREAAAEVTRRQALGSLDDPYRELIAAAGSLDPRRVAAELDAQFSAASFEAVVDHWLLPALDRLGSSWEAGTISVASEHLVANQVMRRLAAAYDHAEPVTSDRPVLIGAPPGVDHQIGILAFAVACRHSGLPTIFLGAQVPLEAWIDAAERSTARAAVTTVPRRRDAAKAAQVVQTLALDGVPTWLGGRYQHVVGGDARLLGHSIADGAAALAAALAEPQDLRPGQPTSCEPISPVSSALSAATVNGSAVTGAAPLPATGDERSMVRTVRGANGADT